MTLVAGQEVWFVLRHASGIGRARLTRPDTRPDGSVIWYGLVEQIGSDSRFQAWFGLREIFESEAAAERHLALKALGGAG